LNLSAEFVDIAHSAEERPNRSSAVEPALAGNAGRRHRERRFAAGGLQLADEAGLLQLVYLAISAVRPLTRGRARDAANAVLAAVGYNFGLLLRWLALLLRIVLAVLAAPSHSNRTIDRSVVITATSRGTRYLFPSLDARRWATL
jgi:hypothetical protein